MASRVHVFDADTPLRESAFFLTNPGDAVPEIIRIDFTVLQTGEVYFKKNQKFLFFVYFSLLVSHVFSSCKILILLATALNNP